MLLSRECYDILKCTMCNQFLSVFPIYMTLNENNEPLSICGRCQIPSDNKTYLRNKIYESVTKNVQFPCMNRQHGCMEDLLPSDMKQHESTCQYRLQLCCLNKRIDRKCNKYFNNSFDHYRTEHVDLILEDSKFEIDTNKDYDIFELLQYDDEIFSFEYNFNRTINQLKCILKSLNCNGRLQKYYAQINLTTDDATLSKQFPVIDEEQTIILNIDNMLDGYGTIVMGTIKININKEQLNLIYDKNLNETCVQELKCSQCGGLLYPPVFQCKNGHYACFTCKNTTCSKCQKVTFSFAFNNESTTPLLFGVPPINTDTLKRQNSLHVVGKEATTGFKFASPKLELPKTPNFTCFSTTQNSNVSSASDITYNIAVQSPINNIIDRVYYQCQFGCDFSANLTNLKLHYNHCLNKTFQCLLFYGNTCTIQKRRKDLIQHILQDHNENIIKINQNVSFKIDNRQQCQFIKFSGISFRLIIQFVNPHLLWRLETIDTTTEFNNYKFEITIFNNNLGKQIIIRESCADLLIIDEYKILNLPCVWLHIDQLKDYISGGIVSFTINIMK